MPVGGDARGVIPVTVYAKRENASAVVRILRVTEVHID
jgi:hypothetical protein